MELSDKELTEMGFNFSYWRYEKNYLCYRDGHFWIDKWLTMKNVFPQSKEEILAIAENNN